MELKNGELTKNGFIKLNQMEADDNEGEVDDLWVTLNSNGFNKDLVMDEVSIQESSILNDHRYASFLALKACPFLMEIFTEACEGRLKVTGFVTPSKELKNAIVEATIGKVRERE